jgi:hypothetical protein
MRALLLGLAFAGAFFVAAEQPLDDPLLDVAFDGPPGWRMVDRYTIVAAGESDDAKP